MLRGAVAMTAAAVAAHAALTPAGAAASNPGANCPPQYLAAVPTHSSAQATGHG
jgi:hypothetical protein